MLPGQIHKARQSGHTDGIFNSAAIYVQGGLKKGKQGSPARAAPVSASPRPEPQPQPSAPTCFPGAGSAQFCGRARGRLRPRSPGGGAPGRAGGRAKWRAGVGARGGRSRLRLGPRGSRPGPPAEARRPPSAARGARGARSLPCADPGGPAEAGARRGSPWDSGAMFMFVANMFRSAQRIQMCLLSSWMDNEHFLCPGF
ncbi:translation initiation factor IF-2-like [Mustela erminea]|uniref:translation initiation factor IF-2-like n=1 Tax=Mustela erminea TaxID=36723 RepID=UPI0013871BD8|nr:translation initiation factor IF-2-like [Mustela erminea]